jgi:hypothetical protein
MFKKETRRRDGETAMTEYEANQRAMREKTARLRTLRLARDAAQKQNAPSKKRAALDLFSLNSYPTFRNGPFPSGHPRAI